MQETNKDKNKSGFRFHFGGNRFAILCLLAIYPIYHVAMAMDQSRRISNCANWIRIIPFICVQHPFELHYKLIILLYESSSSFWYQTSDLCNNIMTSADTDNDLTVVKAAIADRSSESQTSSCLVSSVPICPKCRSTNKRKNKMCRQRDYHQDCHQSWKSWKSPRNRLKISSNIGHVISFSNNSNLFYHSWFPNKSSCGILQCVY